MDRGVYVGHHERSGAGVFLTPEGVERGARISRMTEADRWNQEFVTTSLGNFGQGGATCCSQFFRKQMPRMASHLSWSVLLHNARLKERGEMSHQAGYRQVWRHAAMPSVHAAWFRSEGFQGTAQ